MKIPVFEGWGMSAITPVPHDKMPNLPQLWIWANFEIIDTAQEFSLDAVSDLIEKGWVQATNAMTRKVITQLYETTGLMKSADESTDVWYKPTSNRLQPVTLSFSIDSNPKPENILMLSPLPVPQVGEYAFVEDENEQLFPYYIQWLPLEARQRWVALGETIKKLSLPCLWPPFTERHSIASDELLYHREIAALTTQRRLAISAETRADLLVKEARLAAAHKHIEDLRTMLRKENWLEQWQEVQRMAQELASDYYEYHQQRMKPAVSTPAEPEREQKKLSARKQPPPPPAMKHALHRGLLNALRDGNNFSQDPDRGAAEYTRKLSNEGGQITVAIHPEEGEGWESVIHGLSTLGDGCVDTYMATIAIAMEKNGVERDNIRKPFFISADDILAMRGKKKSNGSYKKSQRAQAIKQLKTISLARIIAIYPRRKKHGAKRKGEDATVIRVEGRLINLLNFKIGEYDTITGDELWEKQEIAIGGWVNMAPKMNKQTIMMLCQMLRYSGRNERYQKRLGIGLTLMFCDNAQRGGMHALFISMGDLLEVSGIVVPRQESEFIEAIEGALEGLKRDKAIEDYEKVVDASETGKKIQREVQEHAQGWFASYLKQIWSFSPPASVQEQKNLL